MDDYEEWRDIPGYEGLYQASTWGNIRSLIRLLPSAVAEGIRKHKQVLRPSTGHAGRLFVALCKDGIPRRFAVHRLVLLTFEGPCPEGMESLHGDGNHLDNRPANLRWGTRLENREDQRRHGRPFGGPKKLTAELAAAIRQATGTQRAIAAEFGVSQVLICKIRKGLVWK